MASSFRNLNSSAGIASHPLDLLTAVLLEAHLALQNVWLWGTNYALVVIRFITIFLYSSSMYTFHLFLISSVSTRSLPFLSFIVPIFGQNASMVFAMFLKRSPVFSRSLYSIIKHCLLKKAFLSLLVTSVTLHLTGCASPPLLAFRFSLFSSCL